MNRADALVGIEATRQYDVHVPVAEARVINRVAIERGTTGGVYFRRACATILVACDHVEIDEIPHLAKGGLIGPSHVQR